MILDLARSLLSHQSTGDLDRDMETAFSALMQVEDERAQQEETAKRGDDAYTVNAGRLPIIRILVEDYGASNIHK